MPNTKRCSHQTREGKQCRMFTKDSTGYCHLHNPKFTKAMSIRNSHSGKMSKGKPKRKQDILNNPRAHKAAKTSVGMFVQVLRQEIRAVVREIMLGEKK